MNERTIEQLIEAAWRAGDSLEVTPREECTMIAWEQAQQCWNIHPTTGCRTFMGRRIVVVDP